MIYKQAQIDKYLKKTDLAIKLFLVYGNNEGLQAEYVRALTASICPDVFDPFQVVYFNCSDVLADTSALMAEYASQSLLGGRRVIVIKDADNNLTKHLKTLFDTVSSDTLIIVSAANLNKKSSLVVLAEGRDDMAVVVKHNMYDGFKSGIQIPESIQIAKEIEAAGVHGIVLSAGFVSKAPMAVMRGAMPIKTLAYYMDMAKFWWLKAALHLVGRIMIPTVPFKEAYFLEDAKKFRAELKCPLIYVGGLVSRAKIDEVLNDGFECVQMARALVHDTDFVNKLAASDETYRSGCKHSNYCIGRMYTKEMRCHHCVDNLPKKLQKEIAKAEAEL